MSQPDKLAEASMELLWESCERGQLDRSLAIFKGLGFSDETLDFTLDPDSYYFPNRRGDRFVRPANVSDDQIPILAIEDSNRYRFRTPVLHRLQRTALLAAGVTVTEIGHVSSAFTLHNDEISSSGGSPGTASVYNRLTPHPREAGSMIESSPTVIFNVEATEKPEPACPGVALHEFVHVAQSLSKPIRREEEILQRELEAYAVQAALLYSYEVPYSAGTAMAAEVDNFRNKYLGRERFAPTPEFRELVGNSPILRKIVK